MPIENRPRFKLGMLARDSQPLGSKCYWFQTGESFVTIAQKLNLKPLWLIHYNFASTDSAEVNWYLREYVGYVRPTRDGNNWMFDPGRKDVKEGRLCIFVPLSRAERLTMVHHYHDLIMKRMHKLLDDFGNPKPQSGLPSFFGNADPGMYSAQEVEYLNALAGYAELIRVLVEPDQYYAQTGRDYVEKPPELPNDYPRKRTDKRPPKGKGYGKGYDAAEAFWKDNIEEPPEVHNAAEMKGVPLSFKGPIRIKLAQELGRTDARDLLDRLKGRIDGERFRFHGERGYTWSRP